MIIKYVEIENILSIEKIRLDFGESGLVLLDGWNNDDQTANAAGKTSILNSVAYGIYGNFPRKVSASDILRQGTKFGYVKVGLVIDNSLFEVYRAKPNNVKYYIDGLEKTMTQDEFESYIQLNYEQYLVSQYSAQTEGLKLISLNDSGKKDFFLQLMKLDKFDSAKKTIDNQLKEKLIEKNKLESDLLDISSRTETLEESLFDEISLMSEISSLSVLALEEKLSQLKQIEEPDFSDLDSKEEKILNVVAELKASIKQAETNKNRLNNVVLKINSIKDRCKNDIHLECPHCFNEVVIGNNGIVSLDEVKATRKQELITLLSEKTELEQLIDSEDLKNNIIVYQKALEKIRQNKISIRQEYTGYVQEIASIEAKIKVNNSKIEMLNNALTRNKEIKSKIEKNKIKQAEIQKLISQLDSDIEITQTIASIFAPTGAPAYVLDSAIDMFNDKLSEYVSMIWPNASYTLRSFKENKSGDIRAKFSEKLIINGKDRSIGALSGGEYRCLSLAIDFAVIDLLESMFGIHINPVMLDEPFNDLDASNRERVLKLLERISADRQIWVIDHASEAKAMFSNIVRVEKTNGISRLV